MGSLAIGYPPIAVGLLYIGNGSGFPISNPNLLFSGNTLKTPNLLVGTSAPVGATVTDLVQVRGDSYFNGIRIGDFGITNNTGDLNIQSAVTINLFGANNGGIGNGGSIQAISGTAETGTSGNLSFLIGSVNTSGSAGLIEFLGADGITTGTVKSGTPINFRAGVNSSATASGLITFTDTLGSSTFTFDTFNGRLSGNKIKCLTQFESADGSAGISTTVTTALLVGKTLTIKNGIITGFA